LGHSSAFAVSPHMMNLGNRLTEKLQKAFPSTPIEYCSGRVVALISPKYPDFGTIEVLDDGEELTLNLGKFTHSHFNNYDDGISDDERADRIVDEVIDFLSEVFADRIEFYGSHSRGGGCRPRGERPRGFLSRCLFGADNFTWSGPL